MSRIICIRRKKLSICKGNAALENPVMSVHRSSEDLCTAAWISTENMFLVLRVYSRSVSPVNCPADDWWCVSARAENIWFPKWWLRNVSTLRNTKHRIEVIKLMKSWWNKPCIKTKSKTLERVKHSLHHNDFCNALTLNVINIVIRTNILLMECFTTLWNKRQERIQSYYDKQVALSADGRLHQRNY